MRVVITCGASVVAHIPAWEGPLPGLGHHIVNPVHKRRGTVSPDDIMTVLSVDWDVLGAPWPDGALGPSEDPCVVIAV